MIWLTGDTHYHIDMGKLSGKNWPEGKSLKKTDYLIVCGDFGLLWTNEPDKTEIWWTKWLDERSWTTLFVDGNHENHIRLNHLDTKEMFGGKVGVVSDSIFHLKRGEIYEIEGCRFFCFGGAESIDKIFRTPGESWWPEEIPTKAEQDYGLDKLQEYRNEVDFIIAHTCPLHYLKLLDNRYGIKANDTTCKYLDHIRKTVKFKKGYSGHFHINHDFGNWHLLYNNIVELEA